MKKNILKIAAATAFAIITLAFLSCTPEGDVYYYTSTAPKSTAPKEVTNVKTTRINETTVRLSWTAPIDDNIRAFYVGRTIAKDDLNVWAFNTVNVVNGKTYYDFTNVYQGFEWQFSVQTVSYDGTYSKPVTVKNSEVLSNSIYAMQIRNNPNFVKVYVAVCDVNNVGIEKVCYAIGSQSAESIISNGTEISLDSDSYYSFDATTNGYYYFAAKLSDGTVIKGDYSESIYGIITN